LYFRHSRDSGEAAVAERLGSDNFPFMARENEKYPIRLFFIVERFG
jgi:hypothetical protein